MYQEYRHKHYIHYIPLIGIALFGVLGFVLFSYDTRFVSALIIALSASYVSWGVIHHTIHKDICMAIITEYIAVSVLGAIIALSLISRM